MFRRIKEAVLRFMGLCPKCGSLLDDNYHGYNHLWYHCHNCSWCEYALHHGGYKCKA